MTTERRNQAGAMEEDVVVIDGVQTEVVVPEQIESFEQLGDKAVPRKDVEQPLPVEEGIGAGAGRLSMPSPCGEPRAFEVGSTL